MVQKGPSSAAGKKNSHGRNEVEENVRHEQRTHTYLLKPLEVYTEAYRYTHIDCHQGERK